MFKPSMRLALPLLTAVLVLCACEDNKKAEFTPLGTLAVDAYALMTFHDACGGGGKIAVCTTETIRSDLEIHIDDPEIARIVPEDEWPISFARQPGRVLVQGVWPGTTKIRGRARFSDGTVRSTSTKLSVKRMDRLTLEVQCPQQADAPNRVRPGQEITFNLLPMLGDKRLEGRFPDVTDDEDVPCDIACTWQAPEEGGELVLRSSYDPKFRDTISTYAPDDITDVIVSKTFLSSVYGPGEVFGLNADVAIRGRRPCKDMPVQVKTLTPKICVGPEDETAWSGREYGFEVKALSDGTCKLALGADGAEDYPSETTLPLTVLSEFTLDQAAWRAGDCDVEGATTCERDYRHMLTCKRGGWVQGKDCGDRVCEMHMKGEGGCKRAEGCPYCR